MSLCGDLRIPGVVHRDRCRIASRCSLYSTGRIICCPSILQILFIRILKCSRFPSARRRRLFLAVSSPMPFDPTHHAITSLGASIPFAPSMPASRHCASSPAHAPPVLFQPVVLLHLARSLCHPLLSSHSSRAFLPRTFDLLPGARSCGIDYICTARCARLGGKQ